MPNRIIRSDILTSERYWSVTTDARQLFQHLMLVADDFGLYTASNYALRATCYGLEKPAPEKVERWLSELQDAELVLLYEVKGQRFVFLPRFKQFVRNKRSRYPIAPNVFKQLAAEMQCIRIADDMHVQRIGKEEEEEEEKKKSKPPAGGAVPALEDLQKKVFDEAVSLLAPEHGEKGARSLVGKIRKVMGDKELVDLLAEARKTTAPVEWLMKCARRAQICKRISDENNGEPVTALKDGRFKCSVHYYSPQGERLVSV
jgi:hypothetical protein